MPVPDHTSLSEHSDILVWIVSGCFLVIGYFITRTLNAINKNQTELSASISTFKNDIYNRINNLSQEFSLLRGEHNALTCAKNPHRRADDILERD